MVANHPVIGWESEQPVPEGYRFNRYLAVHHGRLHLEDIDLTSLFTADTPAPHALPSPLEVVYLPLIRQQIGAMNQMFADVIQEVGYDGRFYYTGMAQAVLLDRLLPGWKEIAFDDGVFLEDLLATAVAPTTTPFNPNG